MRRERCRSQPLRRLPLSSRRRPTPPPNGKKVLEPSAAARWRDVTLGAYLESKGYGEAFRRHYLLPMCAAVWSVPSAQVLEFPVTMLVRFW